MKNKIKYLTIAVGLVLFAYIISNVNLDEILNIFSNIDLVILSITLIIYFFGILFKVLKWRYIAKIISPEFSNTEALASYLVSLSFSVIMPAKMGDLVRIFYLKNKNSEYGMALSAVVMDRIIDIVMLVIMGTISLIVFSYFFNTSIIPNELIFFIILFMLVTIFLLFSRNFGDNIVMPVLKRILPEKLFRILWGYFESYYSGLKILIANPVKLLIASVFGILSWIIPFFYSYTMALSLGIDIPFLYMVVVIPIICIIELLPISVSGIGTRDFALVYLFGLQGISAESALAFSFLYLFICYYLIALIGVLFWLKYPIKITKFEKVKDR
ncbi:flippase-like domain-containing protein [Methanoplanus sp. FWC-SCC4]|uniref:Flippase-like domain-containing protein n=1 Tax=Methanochimaera problematica TaxID=2609417 RepID=A0AA97FDU0_9EURY|nr:lysylphosphatidylglycerol synthase transmembrane domain-containing protein [Methanoplanus sp. FWC-SCC4]WOF17124.1 flippase-like domain-containing protein [Methanoplanus sp. FWC-SCC4]